MGGNEINSFLSGFLGTLGGDIQDKRAKDLELKLDKIKAEKEALNLVINSPDAPIKVKNAAFSSFINLDEEMGGAPKGKGAKKPKTEGGIGGVFQSIESLFGGRREPTPQQGQVLPQVRDIQAQGPFSAAPAQERAQQAATLREQEAATTERMRLETDYSVRESEADKIGLKGEERQRFIATGTFEKTPTPPKPVAGTVNGRATSAYYDPEQRSWVQVDTKAPILGFVPGKAGGAGGEFQQYIDAERAKRGGTLTPEQTTKVIESYAKMHQMSLGDFVARAKASGEVKQEMATQYPQLTTGGQTALVQVEPTIEMMNDLIQKLEPYKSINTPGYFFVKRAEYAVGMAPEEGELASQIANLELSKIIGAMPYATRSRSMMYIQQIQLHLPKVWTDSPALMYQKLQTSKTNFERIKENILKWDVKGAGPGTRTPAANKGTEYHYDAQGNPTD